MRRAFLVWSVVVVAACSGPSHLPDSGGAPSDSGSNTDAGSPDAGKDAGASVDGGLPDAGPPAECLTDLECPVTRFCTNAFCVPRPVQADGGFPCLQACDCRVGEWCQSGSCSADPIRPTFFLRQNGTGNGRSPDQPSGELLDLIENSGAAQTFALSTTGAFELGRPIDIRADSTAIIGGYVECTPRRWVREAFGRSSLRIDGGIGLHVLDAGLVRIEALDLIPSHTCAGGQIEGTNAFHLSLRSVRGRFTSSTDAGCALGTPAIVQCTNCIDAGFDGVVVGPSGLLTDLGPNATAAVRIVGGSGIVRGTTVDLQPGTIASLSLTEVNGNSGPVRIRETVLPLLESPHLKGVVLINCGASIGIENNVFEWPRRGFTGVDGLNCEDVSIVGNTMTQSWSAESIFAGTPIVLTGLSGVRIVGNTIVGDTVQPAVRVSSMYSQFPLEIRDNRVLVRNGSGVFVDVDARAPLTIANNEITANGSYALHLRPTLPASLESGLWFVRGNAIRNVSSTGVGAQLDNGRFWVERNEINSSGFALALRMAAAAELISNHLVGYWALFVDGYVDVALRGNTLDADQFAIRCGYPYPTRLVAEGNILGVRTIQFSSFLRDSDLACSDSTRWRSNYFWGTPGSPVGLTELAHVYKADAGVRDSNNNLHNFDVSCFADAGTYHLAPNSPCVGTGQLLFTSDGGLIAFDLEGQSRLDAGLPDIGAYELH